MSRFFIERPVFPSVLSLVLVRRADVSARLLRVAQYPELQETTVTLT